MGYPPFAVAVHGLWRLDDGGEADGVAIVPIPFVRGVFPLDDDALAALGDIAVRVMRMEGHDFPEGHATLVEARKTDVRGTERDTKGGGDSAT